MANIRLRINPSLASMVDARWSKDWLTVDCPLTGNTTIGEMLARLISEQPAFAPVIFDPETGKINENIDVVLNRNLIVAADASDVKLNDGDDVLLLPIYTGG